MNARDRANAAAQAAALFALALAVRALHLAAMRESRLFDALFGDAAQYDRWAQRIAGGDWLGSEVFYQTPLYPYLMGLLYTVLGHDPWLVRAAQCALGASACVIVALAGARYFGASAGRLAGLLLALYPPAIFFDGILQKASLDLFLMSLLLLATAKERARIGAARLFGAGAALGLTILNRENAAALVPVLAAWAAWTGWPRGASRAAAGVVALAIGLSAVLVPVGLRNRHVGGTFLLTTSQMGSNFWIGNHRGADGGYVPMRAGRGDALFERDDVHRLAEDASQRELTPAEVSSYWMARSWDDIRSAPAEWLRLLAWKWLLTWNRLELVDGEAIATHARHSPVLGALGAVLHFGVLLPLAAAGAWWTRRDWRRIWVLYAMTATFAAAVTLFFVFARYRYPLVPIGALFAGGALACAWRAIRDRGPGSLRDAAIAACVAAAVAVAANWPTAQRYDDDAITYYNAGTALLDAGRVDDALRVLQRARDADPAFPETYGNLGRAQLLRGDAAAAQRELERGIALAPDHAILHLNLAAATMRLGDAARTRAHLERAVALDPLLAEAYGPLAELEMRSGEVAAAVRHLERRVEILPGSAAAHADLGAALLVAQRTAEAARALAAALRLDPALRPVRLSLAFLLATTPDANVRNAAEAVALAEASCAGGDCDDAELLETLAAARAAQGESARAIALAERAAALARAAGRSADAERIERQLAVYRGGRALHELTGPPSR